MSDALFILTVVYAFYVIYSVTSEEETPKKVRVTADKAYKPLVDIPPHKEEPATSEVIAEDVSTPEVIKVKHEVISEEISEPEAVEARAEVDKPAVTPKSAAEHVAPKRIVSTKKDSKSSRRTAAPKIELRTVIMTHPETGEEAKVSNNYRMTKRWVKEALVTEDLLDKVYKNTDLDAPAKIKVARALSIIKAMDKYKVYS